MMQNSPHLELALVRQVQTRTGRRIRDLAVELLPEGVILRGFAATYYLKQLAQQGVREVLPHVRLENAITVHGAAN
jgi:hypothetical protein